MKLHFWTSFVLTAAFFGSTAFGQDEQPLRVDTNLVSVSVAVTDKNGKFVANLRPDQFEIFDNRQKQQIAHFSSEESPVTYGIVYDMHPTTAARTAAVVDTLRLFTESLRPADRFFVVAFNQYGCLHVDFAPTVEQLEKFTPDRREPNSLYDAIYLAADRLRESPNVKRSLIVVSDSADHGSRHSFSEVEKKLKNLDAQVYAVIFDEPGDWSYRDVTREGRRRAAGDASALNRAEMQSLTIKSGGAAHFPASENSRLLFEIFRAISGEVQRQYAIGFYPTEQDGKWHDLRIGLRGADGGRKFTLTYRQGYQSPPPINRK